MISKTQWGPKEVPVLVMNIDAEILNRVLVNGILHWLKEQYVGTHEVHGGNTGMGRYLETSKENSY